MKAVITGAGGQLGRELVCAAPDDINVVAIDRVGLDITKQAAVIERITQELPDLILNAAAYTAVDRAENEVKAAFAVNEAGPAHLAGAATEVGARLIHVSTDFVFDGRSNKPYSPEDTPNPLGVYGASKLAGERAVTAQLVDDALIVRTSWVYSAFGSNFVKTMLQHMNEKESLKVVTDQFGTPSWTGSLAQGLWRIARTNASGIVHLGDAGVASWYDFAIAIQEEALGLGLLDHAIPIAPITTAAYPTPARRPAFSVLDKSMGWRLSETEPLHWRTALRSMLAELVETENA